MRLWGRPLIPVAVLCLATMFLWPILGITGALAFLCISLILLMVRHTQRMSLLMDWLPNARAETVPSPTGTWEEVFASLYRLLRDQTQIQTGLSTALGQFERASAAMPDGVVLLDRVDHIEWLNPRAEVYLGLDLRRDRGQQITNILRQPLFVEYLGQREAAEPVILRVHRGERDQVLSLQAVPYGDDKRLLLCRDVTQLEQVETMRRDFVANVSHEVRTPLTVITGFVETLLEMNRPDPEMTRRSLLYMSEQATRMRDLVDDLLTLSTLESDTHPLREDSIAVPALLQEILQEAQALSHGRHHVSLQVESNVGLRGSREELRSAFTNLVTNALRYTPEGGRIDLRWYSHNDTAVFAVRDTGIGIEAIHIPRLTERFYRVDRSRSRESGGTGLGLAIVKHILNRHHGQLRVQSVVGKGSEFSMVFPSSRIEPGASEVGAPAGHPGFTVPADGDAVKRAAATPAASATGH